MQMCGSAEQQYGGSGRVKISGNEKIYICIDLKSFYASVECVEMGLDPLEADLVVADPSRTERTICLAVSPHLKAQGVRNRCRVYEIPKNLEYIMAPPRMRKYIEYSSRIYSVYLKYVAEEDIHVYSIDECFMDVTSYMGPRGMSPRQFAQTIMNDILVTTGITATCGIGSNMYLAKVALDIISKHAADRIGMLTEESYRAQLWDHLPLDDFWMISSGTVRKLERYGIRTMMEIAHADVRLLRSLFGINYELLYDHAWGRESATIADIKNCVPKSSSLSSGQVLHEGYDIPGARLLVTEMAELLSLDLVSQHKTANSVTMTLSYSFTSGISPAHGTLSLGARTNSTKRILETVRALYDRIAVNDFPVYHVHVCFNNVTEDNDCQYNIFSPPSEQDRECDLQSAIVDIRGKYGKNSIFKGMNLLEGAKTIERNAQIGGHSA